MTFEMKDSGIRQEFESGMVRDVTAGKIDWSLVANGPMLRRWAELLTNGAVVKGYGKRNWMKAAGNDEYERFRESAFRHFMEWYLGERDEDHGAAVFFNINGAEYVEAGLWEPAGTWDVEHDLDYVSNSDPSAVGDVDANDILDAVSQPGGAGDLAEDYNYLRNRVAELSERLYPFEDEPNFFDELLGG